jgi:hypothetical protein
MIIATNMYGHYKGDPRSLPVEGTPEPKIPDVPVCARVSACVCVGDDKRAEIE